MPKILYSTEEAAELIGLSPKYMRKLRSIGGGPRFVKISPKRCMYTIEEIEAWISEKTRAVASIHNERKERIAAAR
jgi:predicted DNA-binding transcriptional regulator AlpA